MLHSSLMDVASDCFRLLAGIVSAVFPRRSPLPFLHTSNQSAQRPNKTNTVSNGRFRINYNIRTNDW
uniref:hypothetical protein n=1 Tax=Prevotella heparinolytica TaxID=28113 RepID=UPI00359F4F18